MQNIFAFETEATRRKHDLDRVVTAAPAGQIQDVRTFLVAIVARSLAAIRLTGESEVTETVPIECIAFGIAMNVKEVLMNRGVFTALTRRASLLTLGAVGLASLAPTNAIHARKKRRKKRNNGDVNNLRLCKKQVGQCVAFFAPLCEDDAECLDVFDRCCASLGNCDFDGFFLCVEAADANLRRIGPRITP